MKISKRILGVVLALIMIFNVFAVGTFAAFPDDTAVKLMLSTDKTKYAPGEEIVITFSEQVIEEVGTMYIGGQYQIAYPTSVLDPFATTTTLEDHGFVALADGYDDSISGMRLNAKIKDDVDENGAANYGWDERIQFNVGDDSTEIDATSAPIALFSVKMKIAEDAAAGTYTIGFNYPAYENENAYVNDSTNEGLYGVDAEAWDFSVPNMYELGTVTFTVGASDPEVTHEKFMGQMKDWTDASATKFNAGFVGKISNLELETNGKEVTNIESIVVEITRGTEKLTGNAYQLYAQADGSYLFRAVVKNAMIADNETVSYKYIVTLANGDQLTAEGTTSFGSIYSDAKTNYDKANS